VALVGVASPARGSLHFATNCLNFGRPCGPRKHSAAAFTSSTSVGIAVGVTVTDVATGEVLFSSLKPGFEVNALQTTTCTIMLDGQEIAFTAFFTPATPARM
jgi:hypothetical protein